MERKYVTLCRLEATGCASDSLSDDLARRQSASRSTSSAPATDTSARESGASEEPEPRHGKTAPRPDPAATGTFFAWDGDGSWNRTTDSTLAREARESGKERIIGNKNPGMVNGIDVAKANDAFFKEEAAARAAD
ncbi:hypothetical protein HO173_010417 [Letharia columbiana]|uniref:Uncharacterized protein n=1 Tax=Letharia columbiana TaxID=112416 RepID=A0A8H6FMX7_9LECA|nr:uncharacterized protein HO173_010417 [Letharia columbiana]KAF6231456.1 hypothetical protein HO173_010417 [Letharia columbiana]